MAWYWCVLTAVLAALAGAGVGILGVWLWRRGRPGGRWLRAPLENHFRPTTFDDLAVAERRFPARVRADLQRALDRLFAGAALARFCGVRKEHAAFEGINFSGLLADAHNPAVAVPPEFEDVDGTVRSAPRGLDAGHRICSAGDNCPSRRLTSSVAAPRT